MRTLFDASGLGRLDQLTRHAPGENFLNQETRDLFIDENLERLCSTCFLCPVKNSDYTKLSCSCMDGFRSLYCGDNS